MDSWMRLQVDLYKKIERAFTNFKKSPKERVTVTYIETRLESLEKQWLMFDDTHNKLITESKKEEYERSDYNLNDFYGQSEELYISYKIALKDSLKTMMSNKKVLPEECEKEVSQSGVKLPRIAIPTFSGYYAQWTTFRDLFQTLIHNNKTLDNVQKLHYLKSYLTGEAEQLLRHLPITNNNYVTSWKILEQRFDNKKFITDCIFKRFFSQKSLTIESCNGLRELFDTTNECLNALKNEGVNIENWDLIVIYILCSKLDNESRKQWESRICSSTNVLPTLQQFLEFIEHRFRSLEFLCNKVVKATSTKSHHVVQSNNEHKVSTCSFCSNSNHKIGNCKTFAKEQLSSRRKFVQTSGLCYNCLGANHSVTSCRLPTRCRICKKKHHSLLHPYINSQPTVNGDVNEQSVATTNVDETTSASNDETQQRNITTCFSNTNCQVVLATALVEADTNTGSKITLRSLLDQGSQASFITESAAQLLGLKRVRCNSVVSGVGGEENASLNCKHVVNVKLRSLQDPSFTVTVKTYVLRKLTSFLPEKKIVVKLWPKLPLIELADPKFNTPNKIDLLLGADVYCQIITEGLLRGSPGTLIAQNTRLGWVLSGKAIEDDENTNVNCGNTFITLHTNICNENFNLKKFWELESDNFSLSKNHYTPDESRCEDIFKTTTERDSSGRYIVKLPFKDEDPSCKYGNSREIAIKRLLSLESRFNKIPDLKTRYTEVFLEYLKLGHMQVIPKDEINKSETVYLPYHEVIRDDKTTTKFRIVFNASSRDNNGISLNSNLMVGPTIQDDLRHILMRWRLHRICLVADIIKMYRQVKVTNQDADYQRLVWRADCTEDIQHLRLERVTFGTAPAPYLAVRTLHQVVYDEGGQYPLASTRVLRDFYMDDLLTGCKSVAEGKQIFTEMTNLLRKGGFELQKWSSNNEQLHKEISDGSKATDNRLQLQENELIKILGLTWNRRTDDFEYSVQLPNICEPITKRKVISDIAKLFDPMGWISPAIIKAKIMIQKLWLTGIGWDDNLPTKLLTEWITYRAELIELTKCRFPRWINVDENSTLELHGFSDASSDAYAAVVYMRIVDTTGNVYVHLVTSKTRVAPIKQVSIPRLELCGAVLLAKLLQEVSVVLNISKTNMRAWTDSTVVLAWLSSHPTRWKTFIANRVSEILNILDRDQWSHVSSRDNPADCASRGINPSDLPSLQLWKTGPSWLQDRILNYNMNQTLDTNLEVKSEKVYHIAKIDELQLWYKFSSLRRLVRVLAYCKRFIKKLKNDYDHNLPVWLTSVELNEALLVCVNQCQQLIFQQEIGDLKEKGIVNKKSKLISLNPFLDDTGIIRVGGRLERAEIGNDIKHPIILPSKSHFTSLVLDEAHQKTLHGGPQLMINYLRTKYWIIDAKNQAKLTVRKCVVCVRQAAQTRNQLMGQLPPARLTPIRAFYRSGVDYAGPIQIRTSKGRGHRAYKGYICLFVCMATRAIHLEAVSDLTSQGFIAAFKRFVARRGHCADLYSDNGTNFVGAARELRSLIAQEKSSLTIDIAECLANNGTTWHFIPPHAPHFGGLWEAGIKSTKHHLRRVIGNSTLTFEELSTLLYQVEACLNSRPLSQMSTNSQDPTPLTPGHFLIGEPLILVPDNNYEKSTISSLKRYQLMQRMLQHFWSRWSCEYLSQFMHRYKWANKTPEPVIGDLVLVKEDGLPPAKWLLGKVTAKHPGLDNLTRVVTLDCNGVSFKRPITKLCVLPVAH